MKRQSYKKPKHRTSGMNSNIGYFNKFQISRIFTLSSNACLIISAPSFYVIFPLIVYSWQSNHTFILKSLIISDNKYNLFFKWRGNWDWRKLNLPKEALKCVVCTGADLWESFANSSLFWLFRPRKEAPSEL